ncbi:MAG: two-component sensor histidine kinase [Alteromonadaceae bacterium]|nr:two-component sensor histidine kinase [Alteromonadaceae bacterium]|tara:strand:+ start:4665 stop:6026 length:1362 start_codon:yes stop_codon:yes gene_type:complete
MSRPLLWKLCGSVAAGAVALFWVVNGLALHTEQQMSFVAPEHQATLVEYAAKAETLYTAGEMAELERWLDALQQKEKTWAAVVRSQVQPMAGSTLSQQFREGFRLGRNVGWKIHLYFEQNPIMDVTFADGHTHFLITLPQRMRPGAYWQQASVLLQVVVPLLLLGLLAFMLYQYLMSPLRKLEVATRQFSEGRLDIRVGSLAGARDDELTALAGTFDRMADRIAQLIRAQRHLIADLSHELRTPLARIDTAVDWADQGLFTDDLLARVRRDCRVMRRLVEDTLTLAWLENEQPRLDTECVDLTELIDSIVDDARFEFPQHGLSVDLPDQALLYNSNHRILGQAIENVVRNGLSHQPTEAELRIALRPTLRGFTITVCDQGPGVPEPHLEAIFRPFFRHGDTPNGLSTGFGLGLALARRQIESLQGSIHAENRPGGGLRMVITLVRHRVTDGQL